MKMENTKSRSLERYSVTKNYQMALNQLNNIETKLIRQSELGEKYCIVMEQYVKKRYLEYIDVKGDSNDWWHLSHFPVVWPGKSTTKVRIVFDGVAKYDGKSLDLICTGPKLQQNVVDSSGCCVWHSWNVLKILCTSTKSTIPENALEIIEPIRKTTVL